MKDSNEAYIQAFKVDRIINKQLEMTPVTKENLQEWSIYLRTISTGIDLIMNEVERIMKEVTHDS